MLMRRTSRSTDTWRYLYRAIDRSGALVDGMFSEHRDMAAAKAFFASAKMVTGVTPSADHRRFHFLRRTATVLRVLQAA
jgi:transposase-like protein